MEGISHDKALDMLEACLRLDPPALRTAVFRLVWFDTADLFDLAITPNVPNACLIRYERLSYDHMLYGDIAKRPSAERMKYALQLIGYSQKAASKRLRGWDAKGVEDKEADH